LVTSEHPTTQSGNDLLVEVGSGTYTFEYPYSV